MKPYIYDSRLIRAKTVEWVFHRHQLAGRAFAVLGLVCVLPIHASAGVIKGVMDDGLCEIRHLLPVAFGRWVDRAQPKQGKEGGER